MGMLCDYFEAPNDDEAAAALGRQPTDYLDGKGIEPIVSLGQLESLLTRRPFTEIVADPESFVVVAADDEQGIVRLGQSVRNNLLAFDADSLPELMKAWMETEELRDFDSVLLHSFLRDLRVMVRHASTKGNGVYCLISA